MIVPSLVVELASVGLMSGKSLGHHLFKLHGLLGRIDLD
jgi:hypothetical protein